MRRFGIAALATLAALAALGVCGSLGVCGAPAVQAAPQPPGQEHEATEVFRAIIRAA